ncbi:alginate lyase family protein [Paraburkholderia xenovorans]|uniref:alginate lyase family protein n=1 Tax=Paraburkholderia xenovorans TaxID=36873 RepID=UPI0038BBE011
MKFVSFIFVVVFANSVQAQDFSVQSRPSLGTVITGANTLVYTIVISSDTAWADPVNLTVSTPPPGVTATFNPSSTINPSPLSMLTVTTTAATPPGRYDLTISGTSNGLVRTGTVTLEVKNAGDVVFSHPGVLLDNAQLDQMVSNINSGQQPWQSGFTNVKNSTLGALDYIPTPVTTVDADGPDGQTLIKDAQAAYTQSLLWYATRNATYAENAIRIMNAWAATFTGELTGDSNMNVASWTGDVWPRAAEIIRYTYLNADNTSKWSSTDIQIFKDWLNRLYVPLVTPGRPYGGYGGNLNASSAAAAINIGVFNDDAATFYRGVWLWRYTLPAYLYASTDGPTPLPPINWPANKGDPADIASLWNYQSLPIDAESEETCRDLGHVRWGLAALANAAQTAYFQNVDLYSERTMGTPNDVRMHNALELDSSYLNAASGTVNPCKAPIAMGSSVGTGELAYAELTHHRGFSLPQTNTYLNTVRPTGASYFINWETLTHFVGE